MESQKPNWQQGKIAGLTGRKDGRGIPELFEASIEFDDGTTLELAMPRHDSSEDRARVLQATFERTTFSECPICLTPDPSSEEHVPPYAIGGTSIVRTCTLCNNEFGSKFEPHLFNWYESTLGAVRLSGGDVLGNRHAGTFLARQTSSGKIALIQHGNADPAINEILDSGTFRLQPIGYDHDRAVIALLKSAYLAACVLLKQIPRTPIAEAVREELLAARDVPRNEPCPLSDWAKSLYIGHTHLKPEPGKIELVHIPWGAGYKLLLAFNRYISIEWPIDPIMPVSNGEATGT